MDQNFSLIEFPLPEILSLNAAKPACCPGGTCGTGGGCKDGGGCDGGGGCIDGGVKSPTSQE